MKSVNEVCRETVQRARYGFANSRDGTAVRDRARQAPWGGGGGRGRGLRCKEENTRTRKSRANIPFLFAESEAERAP